MNSLTWVLSEMLATPLVEQRENLLLVIPTCAFDYFEVLRDGFCGEILVFDEFKVLVDFIISED